MTEEIGPKIQDEKAVVERMIKFYCEKKHSTDSQLCQECSDLLAYSQQRLDRCRYGEDKPTCRKCPVHCYRPDMRERIRTVMRFSGPRLLIRSPITWMRHILHA